MDDASHVGEDAKRKYAYLERANAVLMPPRGVFTKSPAKLKVKRAEEVYSFSRSRHQQVMKIL